MIADEPVTRGPALVGCTAERSIWLHRAADGTATVHKRFDAGPVDAAQREFGAGRLAAGDGVVDHLGLGRCPRTGRPELLLPAMPGGDLARRLERDGPLTPSAAVALGVELARTLERLHALRCDAAPRGLLHGDVKPANVLFDGAGRPLLADLEHAAAIGTAVADADGFTGGSHGFAPIECYLGAAAEPGRDLFGLGATVLAALIGRAPFPTGPAAARRAVAQAGRALIALDGAPASWIDWLAASFAPMHDRPSLATWRQIGEALAADGVLHGEHAADFVAWQGGDAAAGRRLAARCSGRVAARLERRAAVAARLAPLPDGTGPCRGERGAELCRMVTESRAVLARTRWFPREATARSRLAELRARYAAMLPEVAAICAAHAEAGEVVEARRVLGAAHVLLDRLGPPRARVSGDQEPSPWLRHPHELLDAAAREVDREAAVIEAARDELRVALDRFDRDAAAAAVRAAVDRHGGSRPWVARLRDRLHRFEFYLDRVAKLAGVVDEVLALCRQRNIEHHSAALIALRENLRRAGGDSVDDENPRTVARPRPFLRALRDLAGDFPEASRSIEPAAAELRDLLAALTDDARAVLTESVRLLEKPPIPIRPLEQRMLQLDGLALADVLVDRPGCSRDHLVDEIEALRARVEQARATRDRIARGAREAMDRGHLTTAIFDIERAADQFADGDPHAGDGPSLAQQFEEARRRKARLKGALERNHELAAECARLATATDTARVWLARLQEREEILRTLISSLPTERATGFESDLRALHLDMLHAMSADGERRLELLENPERRLHSARKTLIAIENSAPDDAWSTTDAQTAKAILERWDDIVRQLERERPARSSSGARTRRARRPLAFAASMALVVLIGWGTLELLDGRTVIAAVEDALGPPAPIRVVDGVPGIDAGASVDALQAALRSLAPRLPDRTAAVATTGIEAVAALAAGDGSFRAVDAAIERLLGLAADLPERERSAVERLAQRAVRDGFVLAALDGREARLTEILERHATLRRTLSVEESDLLRRALARR